MKIIDISQEVLSRGPVSQGKEDCKYGADAAVLEGNVLSKVPEEKCFFSAAPLNFKGFDGSPCRAYLIEV